MKTGNLFFKRWATVVVALCACGMAFAQTQINDRAGLEAISNNLAGSYILTDDIDLSGANWTPLGTFTGTLDGDGHIISGLTIGSSNPTAFFHTIDGGTVKNLGFENATITDATQARTAVLAGFAKGNALIENCYVANSTIGGRWCVGSFVGRADGAATIRNCYSSAYLYCHDFSGTAGHVGGIIGNIFVDGVTVENCYFSGIIERKLGNDAEGQVAGIVGWNGKGGPNQSNVTGTIQNNVNLAPYLLSNYATNRIASSAQGQAGGEPTPGPNYSLSTTVVSTYNDWGNTAAIIPTNGANYGAAKKDGENITGGDAAAKTEAFYTGLGWDFTSTNGVNGASIWTIAEGASYPCFSWTKDVPSFVVVPVASIALSEDNPVDLSKYIFSGRGRALTFSVSDPRVSLAGSIISLVPPVLVDDVISVTVQDGALAQTTTLQVALESTKSKNANLSGIALSAGTLKPSFDPAVTSYKVLIPSGVSSITSTAAVEDVLSNASGDGAVAVPATQTIVVTAEYGNTKTYTINYVTPTYISDRTGLEAISSNLSGNYLVTADIDLSGANWTPLGTFTGILDGAGHVISGLTINNLDAAALFGTISGNAHISNLGFEGASIYDATHSRTAVLAAFLEGNAIIENCYIANTTITGRWCVGSFVGRARNLTDNGIAAIRNCYSSASIFVPANNDNAGMAGGIIGNIYDGNKMVVENCYFSGVIQKITGTPKTEGSVAGIIGWIGKDDNQTISGHIVQNNVNLSPYLLAPDGKNRIASVRGGGNGDNDPTPGPNYSLSTTILSAYGGWENTGDIVETNSANYGLAKKDGENIPGSDAAAKSQAFWANTLGFDFTVTPVWTMSAGYPVFTWEKSVAHFVTPNSAVDLACEQTLDLTKYIFSGRGLPLTFETADADISVTSAGVVSYAQDVAADKTAIVTVKETGYTESYSLSVNVATCTNTGLKEAKAAVSVIAAKGKIQAAFDGTAAVKLYSVTGVLLDAAVVNGIYTASAQPGVYILTIGGKAYKVAVK
ncbi:MAG: hypothetical protein LBR34_03065 [Prevotella sp.]|jgi:hypothetical protein|nr:hypothetical protein [Prevotella sp.]